MAKATAGVTYIDGLHNTPNDNVAFVGDGTVTRGDVNKARYQNETVTDRLMGVDLAEGQKDRTHIIGFLIDRAPNLPSGYNTTGAATFGDGKLERTTTWATDFGGYHPSGMANWNVGNNTIQHRKWTDLT